MNSNLILPVAGKSSRFPNMRPKWMLTHPNGNFMLIEALKGLNLKKFNKIYVIILKKHLDEYNFESGLRQQFKGIGISNINLVALANETESQAQTVYEGILKGKISGSICIKDCDNYFSFDHNLENFISVEHLSSFNEINPSNKSYVQTNELGHVVNIAEKQIISNIFCTGCYGFSSSEDFKKYFLLLKDKKDLYISHIVYKMILDGIIFRAFKCSNYLDWGTKTEWDKYRSQYKTFFIDLDGVLVENGSEHFDPKWGQTNVIKNNAELIRNLYSSGKVQIIITTSRKSYFKKQIIKELKQKNIPYHQLVLDLLHAKRILINDFSCTNKYPTSISINIPRNSDTLDNFITS